MGWYFAVLKKYAVFSGRAGRREFWMFAFVSTAASFALLVLDAVLNAAVIAATSHYLTVPVLTFAYTLAVLIPLLAVAARRLHDSGRSGLWLLLGLPGLGVTWVLRQLYDIHRTVSPAWGFVPVGIAVLAITAFMLAKGTPGKNRYGPAPQGPGKRGSRRIMCHTKVR